MIDDPARFQIADEVLDLIDRNGIAHSDVHPATLLERTAAVDADQSALASNSGPPELPGLIAASTCKQSVYSNNVPAGYW